MHSCCDPTVLLSKTTEEHKLSKLMRCTNLSHVTINTDAINMHGWSCCLCCTVPRWHVSMFVMRASLVDMNIFRQVAKFVVRLLLFVFLLWHKKYLCIKYYKDAALSCFLSTHSCIKLYRAILSLGCLGQ